MRASVKPKPLQAHVHQWSQVGLYTSGGVSYTTWRCAWCGEYTSTLAGQRP